MFLFSNEKEVDGNQELINLINELRLDIQNSEKKIVEINEESRDGFQLLMVTYYDTGNNKIKLEKIEYYYKSNGQLQGVEYYQNFVKHGKCSYYGRDNTLVEETNYSNGKKHGYGRKYHLDGIIREQTKYVNGIRDSIFTFYNTDGTLWYSKKFEKGKKVEEKYYTKKKY